MLLFKQKKKTGGQVAYSVWLLPDTSVHVSKVSQQEYEYFSNTLRGKGEAPGKPVKEAVFIMAFGGIPKLNNKEGFPNKGDVWEGEFDGDNGLWVAYSDIPDFYYSFEVAEKPFNGKSAIRGVCVENNNSWVFYKNKSISDIKTILQDNKPTLVVKNTESVIPNHHSISFDAKSSGSAGPATGVTVSHTVASGANAYLAGMVVSRQNGSTTTCSYNGDSLALREYQSGVMTANYFDLTSPDSGVHNLVFTFPVNSNATVSGISLLGVEQSNPRRSIAKIGGTLTNTSLSVTSAVGDMVLSIHGNSQNIVCDSNWILDYNVNSNGTRGCTAHRDGVALSTTRTDTSATGYAAMILVSVIEASTGVDSNTERGLYGIGKSSDTSERGLYGSGSHTLSTDYFNVEFGSTAVSAESERALYGLGKLADNSERTLYGQGKNTDNSTRGLYGSGKLADASVRNIYGVGKDTDNSERSLYGTGKDANSSERCLYGTGSVDEHGERGLYGEGIAISSERGLYGVGAGGNGDERPLYGQGKDTSNTERGLYGQGKDSSDSQRGLYGAGKNSDSSEIGLYGQGSDSNSTERGLYGTGEVTTNTERGLYGEAKSSDASEKKLYGVGKDTDNSDRGLYGECVPESSERGLYGEGSLAGPVLKRWNGSEWVEVNLKRYNGESWESINLKCYIDNEWKTVQTS